MNDVACLNEESLNVECSLLHVSYFPVYWINSFVGWRLNLFAQTLHYAILARDSTLYLCRRELCRLLPSTFQDVPFHDSIPWLKSHLIHREHQECNCCKRIAMGNRINAVRVSEMNGNNVQYLGAVDDDGNVLILQLNDKMGSPIRTKVAQSAWGIAIEISHNLVAISSNRHCIDLFQLDSLSFLYRFSGHCHNIPSVEIFYPWLYSASIDGTVRQWHIETGECQQNAVMLDKEWGWCVRTVKDMKCFWLEEKERFIVDLDELDEHLNATKPVLCPCPFPLLFTTTRSHLFIYHAETLQLLTIFQCPDLSSSLQDESYSRLFFIYPIAECGLLWVARQSGLLLLMAVCYNALKHRMELRLVQRVWERPVWGLLGIDVEQVGQVNGLKSWQIKGLFTDGIMMCHELRQNLDEWICCSGDVS